MAAGPQDLILHQYDLSPFSEKARLMLGRKNAAWHACIHSTIMPKPELMELTGGYRQIPVLQIGADLYCGTELIADELERLFPEPSLTAASGPGLGRAFAYWTDETLFWLIVEITCGSGFESCEHEDFNRDREEMLPGLYDLSRMRAALPINVPKLRSHLDLVERQFADGRAFLLGETPDLADIGLYHAVDFLRVCRNGNERIPDDYPAMCRWMRRVAAIGHGRRHEIPRAEALAVARDATPAPPRASTSREAPWPGERARFQPWAPSGLLIEGELVSAEPRRIAIRRHTAMLGETVVHLPRNAGAFVS
ncbi:MAG: glutathione S-transferase family protein [Steroidobacteraceae bacterium]